MDIVKNKVRTHPYKRVAQASGIIIAILAAIWQLNIVLNKVSISKKELIIAPVQRGDLLVTVEGYGTLVSSKVQLLTSSTRATVSEIVLLPGAKIKKGDIIVKLKNPELNQQYNRAKQEMALAQANLRQLKLNHQREILNENALHAQLFAEYESAKIKRAAEATLVEKGIVSQLTFRKSQLNEKQLNQRIEILKQRIKQLAMVHRESINIQQERVKQQQGVVEISARRVNDLIIRSNLNGVLQKLAVALGQSLAAGDEIAIIGSTSNLKALIKIPQSKAQTIELKQKVEIDTRQDKIAGQVTRIDPVVTDNTVEIEVSLQQPLPSSARPYQNVDASIVTNKLTNVLYVQTPSKLNSRTTEILYKVNTARNSANRVNITFGEKAGRFIEIMSGATEAENLIISDLSNYIQPQITLN
ncbi:MAG: HlyD family secretion protein [Thalassotalea sp.]